MTEPIEPTPAAMPEHVEPDIELPVDVEAARKLRSEARNLRERLHAVEAEHEALKADYEQAATVVGAMQHAEIDRHLGTVLIDPADFWATQPDTQQFYNDEFKAMVDPNKVVEAAKALAAQRPHLAKPPSAPPPTDRPLEGLRPGARAAEKPSTPSWADAIRGTTRHG